MSLWGKRLNQRELDVLQEVQMDDEAWVRTVTRGKPCTQDEQDFTFDW